MRVGTEVSLGVVSEGWSRCGRASISPRERERERELVDKFLRCSELRGRMFIQKSSNRI